MLETKDTRSIIAVQANANRWRITGFDVRTPLEPAPNSLAIYAIAELLDGTGAVVAATPLRSSEVTGDALLPLLADVGQRYTQNVAGGTESGLALYLAMKAALYAAKQAVGDFPADATDAAPLAGPAPATTPAVA